LKITFSITAVSGICEGRERQEVGTAIITEGVMAK